MKQAIEEIGLEKISAIVCNNAENMKKMQSKSQLKIHPSFRLTVQPTL